MWSRRPEPSTVGNFRPRQIIGVLVLGRLLLACTPGGAGAQGMTTEECADACVKVGGANCGDAGADCVDACLHQPSADVCGAELQRSVSCFWSAPSYYCADGRTHGTGCEMALSALIACTNPSGSTDGGAGGQGGQNEQQDQVETAGHGGEAAQGGQTG